MKRVEKWKPWPYLLDLIDIISEYDLIYILKSSQIGISWLIAIINDQIANFNITAKNLLLSQGQLEAQDLLSKVTFVHDNLPDWLRLPVDKDNRELLSFKGNSAEVRALPSTAKAGHGFQGTFAARDEVARHEFARENFRAVARSGAKMVELSTANKEDPNNYFQEKTEEYYHHPQTVKEVLPSGVGLYTNPTKPGTCLVFLKWSLRPVREEGMTLDEWWSSKVESRFTKLEIEEQFPSEITDVFKASLTKAYFEVQALEDMGYDACPPKKQTEIDEHNGIIRVYKPSVVGRKYVAYTDPSDGVGDPFVTGVMDFVTGEVVASATGKVKVDECAKIHDELVRAYNDAYNSFEYTGSVGGSFHTILTNLNTPKMAPRYKPDKSIDLEKKGQHISKEFKNAMLGHLAFGIAKRQIVCHDREFMQQAKFVTRDDEGNPATPKKMDFDWVMMMVGLWWLQQFVPAGEYGCRSFSYKE